jgi:signal transduction histidine kinase
MRRRIVLAHLVLAALLLLLLEIPLAVTYAQRERDSATAAVQRDAASLAAFSEEALERPSNHSADAVPTGFGEHGSAGIAVSPKGTTISQRGSEVARLGATAHRALDSARAGHHTSGRVDELYYAASPVGREERPPHPAVLVVRDESAVEHRIHAFWLVLGGIAVVVLVVAALVGDRLARWAVDPLRRLDRHAAALGEGDLGARAEAVEGPQEVTELADTFNDMARRLQVLVDAQQRFVADASHQLRSPLTALRLRLDAIESSVPPATQADLQAAIRETERLSHLIDGLLALARSEGARQQRASIDVHDVVLERVAAWGALADERGVTLEGRCDPRAAADAVPGHLEQIVDNLVDNAIEVTPSGSTVSVSAVVHDDSVEIHVVDEGPGLTEEERAHAFDRFWQSSARRSGSAGLGLSIVDQLVRANEGTVRLDRAVSGGIDAVATFPRASRPAPIP